MSNYDKEVKEAWERWNAELIDAQPTADVDYERGFIEGYTKAESDIFHGGKYAPVKHGRWLIGIGENGEPIGTYCSECGWSWERNIAAIQLNKIFSRIETPRCPYCGAKMDKEDSEK